jgi:hypothetical protein
MIMGLFSKKVNYPELSKEHPAAEQIESLKAPLEKLAGQVSDPLEVIPSDNHGYVFIGKPPKKFGIALLEEGTFKNFVALAKEKGLGDPKILSVIDSLGDAYKNNQDTERYKIEVAGKEVVVTPCQKLEAQIEQIVQSI